MIFPEFINYNLVRSLFIILIEIWSTQRYTQYLNLFFFRKYSNKLSGKPINNQ